MKKEKKTKGRQITSVPIKTPLYAEFREACASQGIRPPWVVARFLEQYIEEHKPADKHAAAAMSKVG